MRTRIFVGILGVALASSLANGQQAPVVTAADYARAERFLRDNVLPLVGGMGVQPTWLSGDRFGYRTTVGGQSQFILVDPAHAAQHVLDEALVPGHIDDADVHAGRGDEGCKAQVDRDAAPLLLGQAVGVHTRQAAYERRLAVIDVPGGTDHGEACGGGSLRGHAAAF